MIQINDIPALLDQLEDHIADDLEGQEPMILRARSWTLSNGEPLVAPF